MVLIRKLLYSSIKYLEVNTRSNESKKKRKLTYSYLLDKITSKLKTWRINQNEAGVRVILPLTSLLPSVLCPPLVCYSVPPRMADICRM